MYKFLITCARGLEAELLTELESLEFSRLEAVSGGVLAHAPLELAMKACLWSRQANKVMLCLTEGRVDDEQGVYNLGRRIAVKPWFHPDTTFCVRAHVNDTRFKNSLYLALKLKDAIVDSVRDVYGRRPSIDTENPELVVSLQIMEGRARVYLELQGQPLHLRGYKKRQSSAPLRETLAASLLAYSEWSSEDLWDPMCGSGTLAIEAALIASNTAPGIQRHFAFESWPLFEEYRDFWATLRSQAKELRCTPGMHIYASDISEQAVQMAQNNAKTAGVDSFITFSVSNIFELQAMQEPGIIVCNPPYGERLEQDEPELLEFYYQLGKHLRRFNGYRLCIITLPEYLKQKLHMKPYKRQRVFNGPIPCEMACYQLGGKP